MSVAENRADVRSARGGGWLPRWSPVMFDVGRHGLRAGQVVWRRGRARVVEQLDVACDPWAQQSAEADAVGEALISDDIARRMSRLLEQGDFRGRRVGLVVGAGVLRFHALTVPPAVLRQAPESVCEALRWEVARESRCEPQELELRYWELDAAGAKRDSVLAACMPTAQPTRWISAMDKVGLEVAHIEAAPAALTRLACALCPPEPREVWGVLDLGATHATVTAVVGDTPAYVRSSAGGVQAWVLQLARKLDLSPQESEALIRETPAAGAADAELDDPDDANCVGLNASLSGMLTAGVEALGREVERCLSYSAGVAGRDVVRLLVAGGGALVPGLCERLEVQLGISVRPLALPGGCDSPRMAAAIGAALLAGENA